MPLFAAILLILLILLILFCHADIDAAAMLIIFAYFLLSPPFISLDAVSLRLLIQTYHDAAPYFYLLCLMAFAAVDAITLRHTPLSPLMLPYAAYFAADFMPPLLLRYADMLLLCRHATPLLRLILMLLTIFDAAEAHIRRFAYTLICYGDAFTLIMSNDTDGFRRYTPLSRF